MQSLTKRDLTTRFVASVLGAVALAGLVSCGERDQAFDAAPSTRAPTPLMSVVIRPSGLSEAEGGEIALDILIEDFTAEANEPALKLGTFVPGQGAPQPVVELAASDETGRAPLVETRPGEWISPRPLSGDLQVSYILPVRNTPPVAGGPPINLRIDGDGFSGSGSSLIMLPLTGADYRLAVKWELAAMGEGAEGVSSYGDGDFELPAGPVERLGRSFFMAGHVKRHPGTGEGSFSSSWSGEPPFDPRPVMSWTGRMHAWMSDFFGDAVEPPYRVFLRYNPMNAGGGAAFTHSFLVTWGKGVTGESLKRILGHEMTHTWTSADLGKWYNEGNAVFYQALLPWRAGLITTDEYLADINRTASRYYTNPKRHTPVDEVLAQFWTDTRVRVLPYDRGAMYFAVLNDRISEHSGGKRSLDTLIRAMIDRRRAGEPVSQSVWLSLLDDEIGDEASAIHASMLAGELIVPESEAFGPCFHRVVREIRQFELGFDMASLVAPDKIIRGLEEGSEAAKAGLRNGDRVRYGTSLDALQQDVSRMLTLQVTRGGETFPITYLPRGEAVDAYQWERLHEVPEGKCTF